MNRLAFYGIVGPSVGMPKEVVDKINAGVKKVLEDPVVKKARGSSPFHRRQHARAVCRADRAPRMPCTRSGAKAEADAGIGHGPTHSPAAHGRFTAAAG